MVCVTICNTKMYSRKALIPLVNSRYTIAGRKNKQIPICCRCIDVNCEKVVEFLNESLQSNQQVKVMVSKKWPKVTPKVPRGLSASFLILYHTNVVI